MNRRGFLSGLLAAFAGPAVVSVDWLMPIHGVKLLMPGLRLVSELRGLDIHCPDEALVGLDTATPPDFFAIMAKLAVRAPRIDRAYAPDIRFEATKPVVDAMTVQAIRNVNAILAPAPWENPKLATFRGIPIEIAA